MNPSISKLFSAASLFVGAALLLPAVAFAGTGSNGVITINCASKTLPSQADVGKALGISNLSDAYGARTRLMVEVNHACRRVGATEVRVALVPPRVAMGDASNPVAVESTRSPRP